MPQITESTVVGAPAGEVWALLRDFAAIGDWHPALPPAEIEDGPADRVGSVRVYPLAGGHRETLVALDDQQRRIAFTFADHAAGLPVRSYTSTIAVRPVTLRPTAAGATRPRARFGSGPQALPRAVLSPD